MYSFRVNESYRGTLTQIARQVYEAESVEERHEIVTSNGLQPVDGHTIGDAVRSSGTGRFVTTLPDHVDSSGDFVVKFAIPDESDALDGRQQNVVEVNVWNSSQDSILVPVVDCNGECDWIVQPRGETETDPTEHDDWDVFVANASNLLASFGMPSNEATVPENIVTLDGELRLCDYGCRTMI